MQYSAFHTRHIGAAHEKKGLPCQDMCLSESDGRHAIAVVSDGHGNRRHFRSERGAQKACEIAADRIREFLNRTDDMAREERESKIQDLKFQICRDWRIAILADAENDPWTQDEIEEQRQILTDDQFTRFKSGETTAFAYGCTLCAVFTADWGWGALQVGDGCLTVIESDGTYRWPMPESILNSGHRTASLCADNPMTDFRHVMEYGCPVGLMVYTDGIEKTFPDQGKEIISMLHWVWKNQRFGDENRLDTLTRLLEELTQRSPLGDDVSIAGMIDPNAEDAAPKFNQNLQLRDLRAMESQREELLTTIQYNRRRLHTIQQDAAQRDAADQIRRILSRRESDLEDITQSIEAMRAQLGLPPLVQPKEEPETPPVPEESRSQEVSDPPPEPQENHSSRRIEERTPYRTEKKIPNPGETEPHRTPPYRQQQTQRREPFPHPRKDPFESFSDLSRFLDEARDEAVNLLNFLRKHF